MLGYLKSFYRLQKDIFLERNLLITLAKNDFKEQFSGSYLGIIWAILRPSLFVFIVWFIFSVGLKTNLVGDGVPFILYFIAGYVPWFFFSDAVGTGMNSVVGNAYLVKRVDFKVNILPVVKIISALFLHVLFLSILVVVFLLQGYKPTIYWLQLPFYTLMLSILLLGINYLISSLRVFTKDVAQAVAVILQFGFWVTPIFWSIDRVPEKYLSILELNPMVYIVTGYRNSFINQVWFWETPMSTLYFLTISLFLLFVGGVVFRKLRPHFGDVL